MAISKAAILRLLDRPGRPALTPKALLRRLGAGVERRRELRALLQELLQTGVLERTGSRYRMARDEEPRADAPSRRRARGRAPTPRGPARRPRSDWVGVLFHETRGFRVRPYRDDALWSVRVAARDLAGAREGDVVVVTPKIGRRKTSGHAREPVGQIVEVLGPPGTPEADFRAVVWRRELPVAFPDEVLAEADRVEARLEPAELARRRDLRDLAFVTIDPATARDHDDAVFVEPGPERCERLWVAIADVSQYVPPGSALDAEACLRGNSVYFPDRAIPMLPERLSGELCSLRPDVDRLAVAVALDIDAQGAVRRTSFHPEALIRSRARLSYEEASGHLEGGRGAGPGRPAWLESLERLRRVAEALMRRRFAAGSIDFDLPSAEIVLGDDGHPVDIIEAPRTLAHRAIEEAMLAANRAVAERLLEAGVPALYRAHEPPEPGDLEALRELLQSFDLLHLRRGQEIGPRDIAQAIQRAEGRPEERLVNLVTLRSMRQARYEASNRGHFALAFEAYTHFTSPIRRYADLVVHRALRSALAEGCARSEAPGRPLEELASHVSQRERVAMVAEREMVDLKKCAFLARRIGETHEGTITGVAPHGVYVTLDEFFVDGLVRIARLPGYVRFDPDNFALVATRSGRRWRLGDRMRVRVASVDRIKAWIDFEPLDQGGAEQPERPKRTERTHRRRPRRPH